MASNAYSFADCQAAITGPNGSFGIGVGAATSEEGITIAMADDKGTLLIGADGFGMHSLHMSKAGMVTVRLLKTSPTNALLMDMYNADTSSAAEYGRNTIVIRDPVRGDEIVCSGCGFRKAPDITFGKVAGVHEWSFNSAQIDTILGTGTPTVVL